MVDGGRWTGRRTLAVVASSIALLAIAAWLFTDSRGGSGRDPSSAVGVNDTRVAAHYVGTQACATCHQTEHQAWKGTHHDLAMQLATPATVLAPFKGERFTERGVTSVFTQRDGKFWVRTEGADGRMQEFAVSHTLGLTPLQQYLIPMPDKGMQAFTVAWDARPKDKGGQRWFHLQAGQNVKPAESLHWTGRQNNWNFMCAECHTTQFKKNFDATTRTYNSTWSAMNVSCESCHGPGSGHVAWAGLSGPARLSDSSHGLVQSLGERKGVQWSIAPQSGNAVRSQEPMAERKEMEMCARCHSHRAQLGDDYVHGKPLLDTHVPSLVRSPEFWPDGQMHGEVYNYASFQQSRMFQKGVTCSDCHNPHTLQLKAPGKQVCFQCHAPAKYDAPAHHFHKAESTGASCAACHMPTTTYMTVDPRHDHSLRVPRPDLSLANGSPNACTQCHTDKKNEWAAQWARQWYPDLHVRQRPLDMALLASEKGDAKALAMLFDVIAQADLSAIVRASALARATPDLEPVHLERIQLLLRDAAPLVRKGAVDALAGAPAELRARWLQPMLNDPVKGVRLVAVRWLAGVPQQAWSDFERARWASVLSEYIAVQTFNADRPEAYNNLGTLYADMGEWPKAEAALRQAIAMDASLAASSLNLADVLREQGREDEAQTLLHSILRREPGNAQAHHALGLSFLRQKHMAQALGSLQQAARLDAANPQWAYVYALALESQGQRQQAVAVLERLLQTHPGHKAALQAAASFCQRLPDPACAQRYAQELSRREKIH